MLPSAVSFNDHCLDTLPEAGHSEAAHCPLPLGDAKLSLGLKQLLRNLCLITSFLVNL